MNLQETRRSFSSGELDPGLRTAEDLELFRTGLRRARNILVSPTGGFRDRGGFAHVSYLRNRLEALALDGATVTAATGGGVVVGVDPITGEPIFIVTDPVVPAGGGAIVHVDFGAAVLVACVDVINLSISGAAAFDSWRVEYSTDNAAWTPWGQDFDAGPDPSTRRSSGQPRDQVTARYWRVLGKADIAGRTVQIPELAFWREGASLSDVQAYGFAFDVDAEYCLFHTDRSIEIFTNGQWVVSVPAPHSHGDVRSVTYAQSLDTLLLFLPARPPWRVFRVRGDGEWDARTQAFENIPRVKYEGMTYSNGVDEKQSVLLLNMDPGTDQFLLRVKGEETGAITFAGDNATTTTNIQTALAATAGVGSGNVSVAKIGNRLWEVTFQGALGQQPVPIMSFAFLGPGTGDEIIDVQRTRQGKFGGEPLFSALRGWPACGRFYQQRLALGGFASRPATVLFSVQGDYFNMDVEIAEGDGAIALGIDDDQMKRIRRFWSGDHFLIFTDDAEFWIVDRAIERGPALSFARSTSRGLFPGSPLLEADDTILFLQRDGRALRGYEFDEGVQSYVAPPVSRLSPHLIRQAGSMAAMRGDGPEGADLVFIANGDGRATVCALLQSERFAPFHDWDTPHGAFLAFGSEGRGTIYAATQRMAGGVTSRRVEIYDPGFLYDAGVSQVHGSPVSVQGGLAHLEGLSVEMWLDGRPHGAAVVSGGQIALPVPATTVQAGLAFTPEAELTPMTAGPGPQGVTDSFVRIHEVTVSVRDTGALSVAANGGPARKAALRRYGPGALKSVDDTLFTGEVHIKGLGGTKRQSTVTITQAFRAPLRVTGVVMHARSTS